MTTAGCIDPHTATPDSLLVYLLGCLHQSTSGTLWLEGLETSTLTGVELA